MLSVMFGLSSAADETWDLSCGLGLSKQKVVCQWKRMEIGTNCNGESIMLVSLNMKMEPVATRRIQQFVNTFF